MFKEITAKDIKENIISAISDEWMLIAAGNESEYNMMTASWGFAGEIWGSDAAVALVRPQRYTKRFLDREDYFTLSFYGDNKAIHKVCGSMSGRNVDKAKLTGLTPVFSEKAPYFEQARLVLVCRKQYCAPLVKEGFCDSEPLDKWYNDDLHYMYIGKIEKVLVSE